MIDDSLYNNQNPKQPGDNEMGEVMLPEWVTTEEAAIISGYSDTALRKLKMANKIHWAVKGRTVLYRRDEMDELARRGKGTWKSKGREKE